MKKPLFLSIALLISLASFSQTVIENPEFSATTAQMVNMSRIELQDTVTVVDFEVNYFPDYWISISSKDTYLQNSRGGEKLFVKRAKGIKLDERHFTPESGKIHYTLYFPPIDKSVETIDYLQEGWKIFDIELKAQDHFSIVPEAIQGNWLRTDGSNSWEFGFYPNMVIYNSESWHQVLINNNGKNFQIKLQQDGKQEILHVKLAKRNQMLIGTDPKHLELYSREKSKNPEYVLQDDAEFTMPVFNKDTAQYNGYIKGYHPKMGVTGMAYVDDIITHNQNSHLITINPDGTFHATLPMIHPQEVFIRMLGINGTVFFEPGKTTFQYIDLLEYYVPFRNDDHRNKRERKSLFMGETARVNMDLQSVDSINYYNYYQSQEKILDMSTAEYKAYVMEIMEKEKSALNAYATNNEIAKKALQIKQMQIPYRAYESIFSFNSHREYAFREKNNIPREQREIPLEKEKLTPEFYDFVDADDLNNPRSLVAGGAYNSYINRVRFADGVFPDKPLMPENRYRYLKEKFAFYQIELSAEENELMQKLMDSKTVEAEKEVYTRDSILVREFGQTYQDIINEAISKVYEEAHEEYMNEALEQYFGLSDGFARDIMFAQGKCERMEATLEPFSEGEKAEIKNKVSNPFIVDYLMLASKTKADEIRKKLEANQDKAGFVVNETPKTEGDKLFGAIMEKYKGKVIFVDFWATWCGPCRSGMEQIKPLKEELKDKDMVFVYLTNHTSPMDKWNMLIPDIEGEHYRVEEDEWNILASRFNISGIPHYILVDKEGEVVKDKMYFSSSNEELKKTFMEYVEE